MCLTRSFLKKLLETLTVYSLYLPITGSVLTNQMSFDQVHKFARELESSFESLNSLISSNRTFSNEKLLTQMKEVFRMIEETIRQEKHQGLLFYLPMCHANILLSRLFQALLRKPKIRRSTDSRRKIHGNSSIGKLQGCKAKC